MGDPPDRRPEELLHKVEFIFRKSYGVAAETGRPTL